MKYLMLISDTPSGITMEMHQGSNGVNDHPEDSLAAMWMARFYTTLEQAHKKGHAYVAAPEEIVRLH